MAKIFFHSGIRLAIVLIIEEIPLEVVFSQLLLALILCFLLGSVSLRLFIFITRSMID